MESLKQPLHISWHITALACGILLGTSLILIIPPAIIIGAEGLVFAVALMIVALAKPIRAMLVLVLVGGVLIGLWQGSQERYRLLEYSIYYGQTVTLTGKVSDDTTYARSGDQQLRLNNVVIDQKALTGQVWVSMRSQADIKRGDVVQVTGTLNEGFGTMSATMFRARLVRAERPQPGDVARKARDSFGVGVYRAMHESQASLGMSYIAGQRRALPETISEQLRILGLTHLVVASGFHLTIFVGFARRSMVNRSKYLAAFFSCIVIGSFLLLTGFSTSMTRAGLVAGISLLAWYYGRNVHPIRLLIVVAAITVLIDPAVIWGDIGWFLSFTAFAGVIILAPLLNHYFWGPTKEPGAGRRIVVATTAAQITTFPVIAYAFGQYSPLALLSNLLILPLVPLAMALTFFSGVMGLLTPGLASFFGAPAYSVLYYMTTVADWLSGLPWAYGEIAFSASWLMASYVLIVTGMVYLWRRTNYNFRLSSAIE